MMPGKPTLVLLLLLLPATIAAAQQSYTISGTITDQATGEELIGASVSVEELPAVGALTNGYGFYSLTMQPGSYNLKYNQIGYRAQYKRVMLYGNQKMNAALDINPIRLAGVEVTADKSNVQITKPQMGESQIAVKDIGRIPMLFGEKDLLKSLQLLPGIKAAGEGQSGYTVRGGTIDQNLVLLDEAPVYSASHLLGFFSAFNADAIKDVTFYKGLAPAQYGGRISSVADIKMNDGNNQRVGVSGGIGLISSKLNIEGPIQKDKSSFLITGRRTYADLFLKLSNRYRDDRIYFYDLNVKANYIFTDKDRIFLSGYFGRDVLGLKDVMGVDWGNSTFTLRWNHLFRDKLFSNTSLIYSDYDYRIDIQSGSSPYTLLSRVRDWNLKQELQYFPNASNSWRAGYNLIYHTVIPRQITNTNGTTETSSIRNGLETAAYLADEWKAGPRVSINYGLRLSDFAVLGGSYYYRLDQALNVADSSYYAAGAIVRNYPLLEPRLSMSYLIDPASSLKAAYARNTQDLHLISNSTTTNPADKWVMNTIIIRPEIADQLSLGYFRNLADNGYECSIEAYYKAMQNQIDYKDAANINNTIIETQLLFGRGRAYGVELLCKKTAGALTGWVGYTISRTEKQIPGINNGGWYPSRQDRTHDITMAAIYDLSAKWNLTATWVYQTGNAVTFPSGKYEVAGQTVWYYTERNGYRMPAYHRLDLGATYRFKHGKQELAFGLYNAYGRENPYTITFEKSDADPSKTVAVQTSLFRWVPSISYNFRF